MRLDVLIERYFRVMRSKIQGWGLFSTQEIEENEMIIEYVGEIIGQAVADKREKVWLLFLPTQ